MSSREPRGRSAGGRSGRSGRAAPRRQLPWLAIVLGLVVVAGLGAVLLFGRQLSANSSPTSSAASPAASAGGGAIEGVQTFSNLSRDHVDGKVDYPQVPPVGGPHNPVWLNCGIYDQPAPNENAVHSLEHGAVWITYQPSLPAADVQKLRDAVRGHAYVLLTPYPGLPGPVVASAWGVQLRLTGASDPRLAQFIRTYEQGPQTPEPGATCTGGRGVPIAP